MSVDAVGEWARSILREVQRIELDLKFALRNVHTDVDDFPSKRHTFGITWVQLLSRSFTRPRERNPDASENAGAIRKALYPVE
jgi:hypothetical protein